MSTWLGSETTALWVEFALFLVRLPRRRLRRAAAALSAEHRPRPGVRRELPHGHGHRRGLRTGAVPRRRVHGRGACSSCCSTRWASCSKATPWASPASPSPSLMDIRARLRQRGAGRASSCRWTPTRWPWATIIVVKPGERVPLDGVVVERHARSWTPPPSPASRVPRDVARGRRGHLRAASTMTGLHHACGSTKPFGESTVSQDPRAGGERQRARRPRRENFITTLRPVLHPRGGRRRAVLLAVVPPARRWASTGPTGCSAALIFLVVSCPCALVISRAPVSFFGGIGGASRVGILVKGSNYLETLAGTETVVFDKTGTLTKGAFNVTAVHPDAGIDPDRAAVASRRTPRAYSDHPISRLHPRRPTARHIDQTRIGEVQEQSRATACAARGRRSTWCSWATTSSWTSCGADVARLRADRAPMLHVARRRATTPATSSSPTW